MNLLAKKYYHALLVHAAGDYRKLEALWRRYGDWKQAYEASGCLLDLEKAWAPVEQNDLQLITPDEKGFPMLLAEIPWRPHALYVRGAMPAVTNALAMVGTRKATAAGLEIAKRFAKELTRAGVTIVSGLALGVDAVSHEGALMGGGATIAVLACGLDEVYPRQNEQLAKRILKNNGALVSEYPPGVPPYQAHFLERNRITSGLASGVLVIEAPLRSGVRSTARFAIEQDRDVFVVPGAITNPNYAGSHELIKSGARLVTEPAEILEQLGIAPKSVRTLFQEGRFDKLTKPQKIILDALQQAGAPLTGDELADRTALSSQDISQTITLLIVSDIIKEEHGTYFIT